MCVHFNEVHLARYAVAFAIRAIVKRNEILFCISIYLRFAEAERERERDNNVLNLQKKRKEQKSHSAFAGKLVIIFTIGKSFRTSRAKIASA